MCDTDVTYKFSELSEKAKDKARDEYRSGDYPGYDWWDNVYEDAVHCAALMGITISSTTHQSQRDPERTWTEPDIGFSGFGCQSSGASFEGSYRIEPDAVQKVTSETNDEELIRIATELSVLQITRRLHGFAPFQATISERGNYYRMDVEVHFEEEDEDPINEIEADVRQLMQDFAGWIYEQLETEHNYLCSDEYIDEYLNDSDDEYDEFGSKI